MKNCKTFFLATVMVAATAASGYAFDLSSLLKSATSSSTLSSIIDGVISTDDISVADLEGTWSYTGPAVSFASEDLLEKAGGSVVTSQIEEELEPYYEKAGLTGMTFVFDSEGNVTVTLKSGKTISGTVTEGDTSGTMVFNFASSLSKISSKLSSVGNLTAYVTKGTSLSIMFDASKLQTVVSTLSSLTSNSTLSTLSSLLSSYDGVYAGFKFSK